MTAYRGPSPDEPLRQLVTQCIADIPREDLEWLWPGRLPLGKLVVLAGDPGLGKSLMTLDIAARVSRGSTWPIRGDGNAISADVMVVSAEDDAADTIRPRLEAAGANLERIHVIEGIKERSKEGAERTRGWTLADLPELERRLYALPEVSLLIVDPLSAFLAGTDSHKNADVRALLAPLADLARRHRLTVLAVSHLNKGGGPAIYRTTGSLAFVAAARAVYVVTKDKDDDKRRLVLPVKANLAPDLAGLAYRIGQAEDGTPRVEWEPEPVAVNPDEALAALEPSEERSATDECVDWLEDALALGPRPAEEMLKEARKYNFTDKVIRRARGRLGIKPHKRGFQGGYLWALPEYWAQMAPPSPNDAPAPDGAPLDPKGAIGPESGAEPADGTPEA